MAQENFAGPEYFTEFDPEKFFKQLQKQKEEQDKQAAGEISGEEQED